MTVYTRTELTTDHGSRFLAKPNLIVLHHGATTSLKGLIATMMPGGRTVSAHAAIGGDEIVNVVPEGRRSFSLGAAIFERRVLSAECVNDTLAPAYTLSAETEESIARWVADVAKRWGIRPHREGPPKSWTVIGHREAKTIHGVSYATACPGGMQLDRIVRRAQELLAKPAGKGEEIMATNYVNIDTYVTKPGSTHKQGGRAGVGTKCLTLWEGGRVEIYDRAPADAHEMAKVMTTAFGPHIEVKAAVFDRLARQTVGGTPTTPAVSPAAVANATVDELQRRLAT